MRFPALIVLLLIGTVAVASETGELRLVSTVWPPFTDVAEKPRLAAELVHEALKRGGVDAETYIVPDPELVSSMRDGSHAGSGALWRSPERERFLLYSKPYMENRLVLVGRKGSSVRATSFDELAGKRVALIDGFAYGPDVDDATGPIFVYGDSIEQNLRAVLDGKTDYMVIDALVIRYIVEQHRQDAEAHLAIGTKSLARRTLHFAIRKDIPGAEAIVERFDEEIRGMLADGTYNRILDLAWIHADVDGDGQAEFVLEGDHAGETPPTDAYEVVTTDEAPEEAPKKLRFLVGGNLYKDWENVPAHYKVADSPRGADPNRSAAPMFKIKF
jgi:hypothetical protein